MGEAELAFAAEACGDLGVEDSDGDVLERPAHEGHVEVSAVEPDVGTVEVGDERGEVFDADGVDEDLAVADAHLDETEFFAVGVEGIGLGIEGDADAIASGETGDEGVEGLWGIDEVVGGGGIRHWERVRRGVGGGAVHWRRPVRSISALLPVALMLRMRTSRASPAGIWAIWRRMALMRRNSSGW